MGLLRIRSIKPEFFVHEELASLQPLARLLFIGLWTVADREGRLEDRPRRLKAVVLPYDDVDIEELLEELAAAGFIRRYEVDGNKYVDLPSFSTHQRPGNREPASIVPPCPLEHAQACLSTLKQKKARARLLEGNGNGKGKEREGKYISLASLALGPSRFPQFWDPYPKKRHKPDAEKAWRQVDGDTHCDAILVGLASWKASAAWARGYIEDPATFLRQRQWQDAPPVEAQTRADHEAATAREARERVKARLFGTEGT